MAVKRKRRTKLPNKNQIRSLAQFKELPEEEFEAIWQEKYVSQLRPDLGSEMEERIADRLEDFEDDYDLSDLKINDRLVLRALVQAIIQLEDLEQEVYTIREEGVTAGNVAVLRETNNMMSVLRRDISNMQQDLSITRKIRKGDKETSVLTYLEDLKSKAKQFYQSKMQYVFCPKCKMLLATVWVQYPDSKKNSLRLVCGRTLENGEKCNEVVTVSIKELIDNRGINIEGGVPEFFK